MSKAEDIIKILQTSDNPAKVVQLQALAKKPLENPPEEFVRVLKELTVCEDIGCRFWAKKALALISPMEARVPASAPAGEALPLDVLLKKLADAKSHFVANETLHKILAQKDPSSIAPLVEYLGKCKDVIVIAFLVKHLPMFFPSEEMLAIVEPFLTHADERVQANAIEGIEAVQSPKAVMLISGMLSSPNHRNRANAAKALSKQNPEMTREVILEMLAQVDQPHYVIAACHAIKQIRGEQFFPQLVELFPDPNSGDAALDAIVGIGGEAAIGYLEATAETEDIELKAKIMKAIGMVRSGNKLKAAVDTVEKGAEIFGKFRDSIQKKVKECGEGLSEQKNSLSDPAFSWIKNSIENQPLYMKAGVVIVAWFIIMAIIAALFPSGNHALSLGFALIMVLSLLGFPIGLVFPDKFGFQSRTTLMKTFGLAFLISTSLFGVFLTPEEKARLEKQRIEQEKIDEAQRVKREKEAEIAAENEKLEIAKREAESKNKKGFFESLFSSSSNQTEKKFPPSSPNVKQSELEETPLVAFARKNHANDLEKFLDTLREDFQKNKSELTDPAFKKWVSDKNIELRDLDLIVAGKVSNTKIHLLVWTVSMEMPRGRRIDLDCAESPT